jgi:RNA polymerase sigma-70 factor (ECF subfamily)
MYVPVNDARARTIIPGLRAVTADPLDALLAKVAGRDAAAFRVLYDTVGAKLLGVAKRILKRQDLAEDVVHDVFVKVWTGVAAYDPSLGSAMGYLATLARNRALDVARKKTEDSVEEQPQMVVEIADTTPNPEAVAADRAELRAVLACLQNLPAGQRSAIVAAYLDGATGPEIASKLSVPLGTVKTWLSRGLVALRECLGK